MARDDEDERSDKATLSELVGAVEGSEIQLGRHADLIGPLPSGAGVVDVVYATFKVPKRCAVRLQIDPNFFFQGATVNVVETTFGARFLRTFTLNPGRSKIIRLFGRMLSVTVGPTSGGISAGNTVRVNAQLVPDQDLDALGDLATTWLPNTAPATGIPKSLLTTPGTVLRVEGDLAAPGSGDAGPYYLQFFDLTASPVSGVAVPFYVIGPIAVGTDFSADHTVRPELDFANTLWAAFSTTDSIYTAVSSGGGLDARIDVAVGQ